MSSSGCGQPIGHGVRIGRLPRVAKPGRILRNPNNRAVVEPGGLNVERVRTSRPGDGCPNMSGNESINMAVELDVDFEPVAYCAFRFSDGDRMIAIWTDAIAVDDDPGVPATITFPGLTAGTVTGIDVLHGFEQELVFDTDGNDTVIRHLLVKDYPILIRLSDVTMGPNYEETVGDGFHRIGDIDAVPSSAGGSDRDGDGVPDDKDFCPDWPGSSETSGC